MNDYQRGLLRAAEICDGVATFGLSANAAGDAIRAEAEKNADGQAAQTAEPSQEGSGPAPSAPDEAEKAPERSMALAEMQLLRDVYMHWLAKQGPTKAMVEAGASRFMSFLPDNNRATADEDRYAAKEIFLAMLAARPKLPCSDGLIDKWNEGAIRAEAEKNADGHPQVNAGELATGESQQAGCKGVPSAPDETLIEEIAEEGNRYWYQQRGVNVPDAIEWAIREYLKRREGK